MKVIADEELDGLEDASIVQQVTIVELLFLVFIAAIIAFAAFLYYPEARRHHFPHLAQDPTNSQRFTLGRQST